MAEEFGGTSILEGSFHNHPLYSGSTLDGEIFQPSGNDAYNLTLNFRGYKSSLRRLGCSTSSSYDDTPPTPPSFAPCSPTLYLRVASSQLPPWLLSFLMTLTSATSTPLLTAFSVRLSQSMG
ncbi:hypothetical protein FRC08_010575 [Ceratobasidium sp. 394]|nr:hypothetical protein FRC08_010575 [Ceratobasidium sp. 394]